MPVGIKDIIDVAGLPTTCHSKILLDNVRTADAVVVSKLRQAGAVILGKLSTHEFALGGPSFDLPFPPARNPWNPAHHPGGSSSGSGAGVCAGLFPLALGTDTGGSVRNPASACGIVGLKPTYGLVSRRGVFPLSFTLDHVGPLTRTVADSALLLDAIAGHDPADPGSAPSSARHFGRDADARRARPAHRLRAPLPRDRHAGHPEVTAALEDAARVLQAEGAEVRDVTLPTLNEFAAVNRVILGAEALSIHAPWLRARPGDYGQLARRRLLAGAFISAGDYVGAQRRRAQMIAAVNEAFRDFDVLLCASSLDPASRLDDAGGDRAHLSAPGAHAVQRHRPSGAGDDERPVATPACRCRCSSSAAISRRRQCCASPPPMNAAPSGTSAVRRSAERTTGNFAMSRCVAVAPTSLHRVP